MYVPGLLLKVVKQKPRLLNIQGFDKTLKYSFYMFYRLSTG